MMGRKAAPAIQSLLELGRRLADTHTKHLFHSAHFIQIFQPEFKTSDESRKYIQWKKNRRI